MIMPIKANQRLNLKKLGKETNSKSKAIKPNKTI